jgi:two-component system, OmpR family, response regulator VicR
MITYSPSSPQAAQRSTSIERVRVLVIEDEPQIAEILVELLENDGYEVRRAKTGGEAEDVLEEGWPDLVMLDLMLPDADGLVLCSEIHAKTPAPIIILSATKRQRDRVLSLRLGADDFIAKPFDVHELMARVEAVMRRASSAHSAPTSPPTFEPSRAVHGELGARLGSELRASSDDESASEAAANSRSTATHLEPCQVGEMTIDPRRRIVTIGGEPVHLTPTENRLISTLASEPERVFSRDELAESLWGPTTLGESRAVDVHIRRLRAKLEPFGDSAPPIVTVRGFGYTLSSQHPAAAL